MSAPITEDEIESAYWLRWKLTCGCGSPDAGLAIVHKILYAASFDDRPRRLREILPDDTYFGAGVAALILGALDEVDLLEHGSFRYGSWLTPEGKLLLKVLDVIMTVDDDALPNYDLLDELRDHQAFVAWAAKYEGVPA